MRYRLKLKRLDFISPVDSPAQETAKVVLIKREAEGTARVVKVADELGLVFCWAFTSKANGESYYDLHGDTIDEDFVAAAAAFMEQGGPTDEMHDGEPDGRVVFAMPMTPEIAKAFGVETDTTGLMVALKPSPDVLAKFKSGEYAAVSIAGIGERVAEKRAAISTQAADASKAEPMTIVVLTEAQKAHHDTLTGADAEAFVAMASADRDAEITKALDADPIVFAGELTGLSVRKSQGEFALKLAKAAEAAEKRAKDAETRENAERVAKETEVLKARAKSELGHLPGAEDVKVSVLRAIAGIEGALEMFKGADAVLKDAAVAKGYDPGADAQPLEPKDEYEQLVAKAMSEHKADRASATAMVLATKRGLELYADIKTAPKTK